MTTSIARLDCDEQTARRLATTLGELSDDGAIAAFEREDGHWAVEITFDAAPDQSAIRAMIGEHAGPQAAAALQFDTIEQRDWVAASLEGLPMVRRRPLHRAWRASSRRPARQHDRHRDRSRARLRHRTSRHHPRLPARDRPPGEAAALPSRARRRHRNRRARDCRGAAVPPASLCQRHRSGRGQGRARQCLLTIAPAPSSPSLSAMRGAHCRGAAHSIW